MYKELGHKIFFGMQKRGSEDGKSESNGRFSAAENHSIPIMLPAIPSVRLTISTFSNSSGSWHDPMVLSLLFNPFFIKILIDTV